MEYYTEEATSSLNNVTESGQSEVYDDGEEDFCKYRKEQVFQEIDFMNRKTKIACTIGPAVADVNKIISLFDAGMSVARFNMSHGNQKQNANLLKKYQEAKRLRPYKTCALMMDMRGRSIRTSHVAEPIVFKEGDVVEIRTDGADITSTREEIQINYFDLPPVMREGDMVIIGDQGELRGETKDIARTSFTIEIKAGGVLKSHDIIKIPSNRIQQLPVLMLDDKIDIKESAGKYFFDYIVVPKVLSGRDIQEIRLTLGEQASRIQIIARIDTLEALQNFEGIIKQADGVVILRNELGMELEPEKLMIAQKWMTQTANQASIPVFLQSQVLESMSCVDLGGPKFANQQRQETQDISSAVLEGCDVFILSHETSVGAEPVESTILLAKAIAEAENVFDHEQAYQELRNIAKEQGKNGSVMDMLCSTATQIALDNNVDLFVVLTDTGKIARYLAKQRPMRTILACSTKQQVVRQCNTSRGVIGYKVPEHIKKHQEKLLSLVMMVMKEQGFCLQGNKVMIFTVEQEGTPNETVNFKMIEVEEE